MLQAALWNGPERTSDCDDFATPPRDPQRSAAAVATAAAMAERRATFNAALDSLCELLWRSPDNCLAATKAGAVLALTGCIFSTASHLPPNPVTLQLLRALVTCDAHRETIHDTLVSCLTIPALVRLLDASLLHAPPEHRCASPLTGSGLSELRCVIRYIRHEELGMRS